MPELRKWLDEIRQAKTRMYNKSLHQSRYTGRRQTKLIFLTVGGGDRLSLF